MPDGPQQNTIYDATGAAIPGGRVGGWLIGIRATVERLMGISFPDAVNALILTLTIVSLAISGVGIYIAFKALRSSDMSAAQQLTALIGAEDSLKRVDDGIRIERDLLTNASKALSDTSDILKSGTAASVKAATTLERDR